ncbi:MAG: MGMT family protein [Methylococcaceae bacterium]|nr:MGMT family protein [Methylococcaceae bacterium]
MPINITWVDSCDGVEEVERQHTPVCTIKIHRRKDVITSIEWDFSQDADAIENNDKQILDFWPESKETVNVKLLKQGTVHQNKVWAELLTIPLGETLTYSTLAKKIGSGARAVGNACRTNPYTLLIPCHRVVAVKGMGGYSGHRHGEYMKIKERLLDFEANLANNNLINSIHGSTTERSACGANSPRTEFAVHRSS